MYLSNRPGTNPPVDKVSIHFTIRVHRRDRAIVGDKSRVTLLKEEAEIGQLEVTTIRTIALDLVSQRRKHIPERGCSTVRLNQQIQLGGQGFIKPVRKPIWPRGGVRHLSTQGQYLSQSKFP